MQRLSLNARIAVFRNAQPVAIHSAGRPINEINHVIMKLIFSLINSIHFSGGFYDGKR